MEKLEPSSNVAVSLKVYVTPDASMYGVITKRDEFLTAEKALGRAGVLGDWESKVHA